MSLINTIVIKMKYANKESRRESRRTYSQARQHNSKFVSTSPLRLSRAVVANKRGFTGSSGSRTHITLLETRVGTTLRRGDPAYGFLSSLLFRSPRPDNKPTALRQRQSGVIRSFTSRALWARGQPKPHKLRRFVSFRGAVNTPPPRPEKLTMSEKLRLFGGNFKKYCSFEWHLSCIIHDKNQSREYYRLYKLSETKGTTIVSAEGVNTKCVTVLLQRRLLSES